MAKLVLSIQPKDEGALKSVQALKAEVQSLTKSLSSIKINSSGVEMTRKGYANLITTLKTLKSQYADGVFGKLPEEAENAFKKISEISAAFQKNGKLTNAQAKEFAQLSQQLKKLSADLATVKAKNDKIVAANPFTVTQAQQIPRLIKQYSTLLNHIKSIEKYYPKGTFDTFKADLTQGQADLQALNNEFQTTGTLSQDSQVKLNALANAYNQVGAAVKKSETEMKSSKGTLKDIVSGFAKFQLAAMLVMKPLQWIRSALTSLNETLVKTEDAVIALQRVLPTGSATDDEISSKVYDIAQRNGQTFENVSQIATNFARTGMSWADTIKATEAAVLALNVAELDAEEATTGLIAILSQFNLEASDLETVIDKLNKTADNFPVTTEKILAALQRTGSAASNANLSLDQTIALITALSKATGRSGENIGTALNSLIQYSSKASALDTFAALSDESAKVVENFRKGMLKENGEAYTILDVWRQVSAEIQNLKSDQADLLDQYFNTEDGEALKDALDGELEDIYTELSGVYDTANTFRKNYFIALLGNMDTVEQAMGTLGDAAGYSQKENEKYLATYTAKLNTVKAQWQDIANSEQGLLGIKKALVDVGSVLLTIIKWTGGLRTTLLAISTVVWLLVGNKILAGLTAIGTIIKGLITGLRTATTAAQGLHAALGAIGLIATAVSLVVGIVQQANASVRQARLEAIEHWQSIEEQAYQLDELSDKYASLTRESEEYAEVENGIVDLLGTKAIRLATLTKGTEEYRKEVERLTEEQRKQNKEAAQRAANAARDLFEGQHFSGLQRYTVDSQRIGNGFNDSDMESRQTEMETLFDALSAAGYSVDRYESSDKGGGYEIKHAYAKLLLNGDTFKDEETLSDIIDFLSENGYGDTAFYNEVYDAWQERNTAILEYLKSFTPSYAYEDIADNETFDRIVQNVMDATGATENWRSAIEGIISSISGYKKVQDDVTNKAVKWHNNIAKATKKYDDLIDRLKGLRDAEKESLELEERKQAVLEAQEALKEKENELLERQNELIKAQQALENARNEATIRRFNEATGQWEWKVDERKVAEAEENVKKAQEDVDEAQKDILEAQEDIQEAIRDLEEQAYDTIIDQLENNTATNEGLNALLDGLKDYLGEDFIRGIKDAILSGTGVDLDKPINEAESGAPKKGAWKSYEDAANAGFANIKTAREFNRGGRDKEQYGDYQSYLDAMYDKYMGGGNFDKGGAAIGKGLMPKETDEIETVNGPDLTAKILAPVSNDQFHRYVRDMGLLFETSRQYAQTPVIERMGGNTDNRVDNSGQVIIKDVNVGAEQRNNLLGILALGGIVPKV